MQRLSVSSLLAALCLLTACASHSKKIIVYASSNIQADNTGMNITVSEGTTHHEQEFDYKGGDPVTLSIQSPTGKYTLEAKDDGLYIVNLKNDTVVGSFQHVGSENADTRISQDALKMKLDSLQKLVAGLNITTGNRNYFITPGKIEKISADPRAKVFGPYTTIPGSFDAGSVPEIYKFYTNKEIWEIINNLNKMTIGKKI
jgi:major membrane immunogen (membrane-anchored lipoprotein)